MFKLVPILYLGPQPTPKPQLLKTDVAVWLAALISILAIFNVFINSKNSSTKILSDIAAKLFVVVLPPYWILRNIFIDIAKITFSSHGSQTAP